VKDVKQEFDLYGYYKCKPEASPLLLLMKTFCAVM